MLMMIVFDGRLMVTCCMGGVISTHQLL